MYYQMLPRMSLETGEQLTSPAVSAENISVLVASCTVYNAAGTGPSAAVDIQTSDDGEVWATVATILTATTPGVTLGHLSLTSNPWGRLVRTKITVTGTNSIFEFALGLHTHQSS